MNKCMYSVYVYVYAVHSAGVVRNPTPLSPDSIIDFEPPILYYS